MKNTNLHLATNISNSNELPPAKTEHSKIIAFIHQLETKVAANWLELIRQNLPNETIKLPHELNQEEKRKVDIAIVANPDPKVLNHFENLIWIQSLWAGVETLIHQLPNRNIKLVRLIDPELSKTMAESVLAWTLYLHRNMPEYILQQQSKNWLQLPYKPAKEIRISILGAGELGLSSIHILKDFGYQVSCWSRSEKNINGVNSFSQSHGLSLMLKQTDILICLLPLTKDTVHLLNDEYLKLLPKGAKLINFSRGAIIDTNALIPLLDSKRLSHAVLDVFEEEPLPVENKIWQHSQITVLPHISATTNIETAVKIIAHNIQQYRNANMIPESVNLTKGY